MSSGSKLIKLAFSMVLAVAAAGCSDHGRMAIPDRADRLGAGQGKDQITVTTPHYGTAYVLDKTDDRLVWSGDVHTDDKLVIDGNGHRIALNGRTVSDDVHPDHRYVIFYNNPS